MLAVLLNSQLLRLRGTFRIIFHLPLAVLFATVQKQVISGLTLDGLQG